MLAAASAPPQPIPFSHKLHTAQVACNICHTSATTGEQAGLPAVAQCMLCHENLKKDTAALRKLASYAQENKPVPWRRIYKVRDYVFFSHTKHTAARVECATCHGPVAQRTALAREVNLNMKFCVDCHRRRGASMECSLCHELNQ